MGIRDFFSSGGRAKGKLGRATKTATNPYAQSADRYGAMEQLLDIGAKDDEQMTEAYVGLLRRFTITSTKSIEDEEEKGWVYRRLTAVGKPILPAVKQFCLEYDQVAWALRIIEDVASEEEEWAILDALLAAHPPGYENPQKKVQILIHLQEIDDPKVVELLCGYLEDADEPVRFQVLEALIDIGEPEALEPIVERLTNEEEDSIRLRARMLDGLATLGWNVHDYATRIAEHLGHDFAFEKSEGSVKIVRR